MSMLIAALGIFAVLAGSRRQAGWLMLAGVAAVVAAAVQAIMLGDFPALLGILALAAGVEAIALVRTIAARLRETDRPGSAGFFEPAE